MTGDVSRYMGKQPSVRLAKHFKLDTQRHKIVLVEGAPGAGKSTFAWHICLKWKAGKLFYKFSDCPDVQLRDPMIKSAKSLSDTFPIESMEDITRVIGLRVLLISMSSKAPFHKSLLATQQISISTTIHS